MPTQYKNVKFWSPVVIPSWPRGHNLIKLKSKLKRCFHKFQLVLGKKKFKDFHDILPYSTLTLPLTFVTSPYPGGHDIALWYFFLSIKFSLFSYLPLNRVWSLFRTNLNSHGPRVLCAKLVKIDWFCRGRWKCKQFTTTTTTWRLWQTTNTFLLVKLTWDFGSAELKLHNLRYLFSLFLYVIKACCITYQYFY